MAQTPISVEVRSKLCQHQWRWSVISIQIYFDMPRLPHYHLTTHILIISNLRIASTTYSSIATKVFCRPFCWAFRPAVAWFFHFSLTSTLATDNDILNDNTFGNIAKLCTQNSLELFYPNPPYKVSNYLPNLGKKMVEQHLSDGQKKLPNTNSSSTLVDFQKTRQLGLCCVALWCSMRGSCRSNVLKANLPCKMRWAHDRLRRQKKQLEIVSKFFNLCKIQMPWNVKKHCFSQWFWKCSGSTGAEKPLFKQNANISSMSNFFWITTSTNTALYDIFCTLQPEKTDSWNFLHSWNHAAVFQVFWYDLNCTPTEGSLR